MGCWGSRHWHPSPGTTAEACWTKKIKVRVRGEGGREGKREGKTEGERKREGDRERERERGRERKR